MGMLTHFRDGFINFITGLGTSKDPSAGLCYNYHELNRSELEAAYRSNWIARTVVNAPAEDATKEWRSWQAGKEEIESIEEVEKLHSIQMKMKQALTRARLYGGAALVIGVEQGNIEEPLDLDAVGEGDLKWVVVMNRYELNAGPRIFDVESEWYTRPEYYMVATPTIGVDNRYPGQVSGGARMHPSRVIEFVGNELPDWRLAPLGGNWGDSVIQTLDETLKDWGLSLGGIANMINDAKLDIFKIPKFSKNISDDKYAYALLRRFSTANMMKSNINSIILDTEEEHNRIQTTFAGLPQILQMLMPIVSAAGGIPVSRLMGQAPGKGLSQSTSGGESDLYNYYDGIASKQKNEYSPAMTSLDQVIIRNALGKYDPSIYYDWTPLYTPDPKEVAAIALQKMQTTQGYVNMGLINEDVMRAVTVNQLTEDLTYPGLDDAIDEFGAEPEEPETPSPEDMQAHIGMLQSSSRQLQQLGQFANGSNTQDAHSRVTDGDPIRPIAELPRRSDGLFAQPDWSKMSEKQIADYARDMQHRRQSAAHLADYADRVTGLTNTSDPTGKYNCGGCNKRNNLTGNCTAVHAAENMLLQVNSETGSCDKYEIECDGDPEHDNPVLSIKKAGYVVGVGTFGCHHCSLQEPSGFVDELGRSLFCNEWAFTVHPKESCCGENNAPTYVLNDDGSVKSPLTIQGDDDDDNYAKHVQDALRRKFGD